LIIGIVINILIGNSLIAPVHDSIPLPSTTPQLEEVAFPSTSGALLKGWYGHDKATVASMLLLHGARSNRQEMLKRAELLLHQHIDVLLFDFQAHGESTGNALTFGYLEARDVEAAFRYLRERSGTLPIGSLGFSLGGIAALLSNVSQKFDFLVLEAVYPTFEKAIDNRLSMRFGRVGPFLTPLLLFQLRWRIGITPDQLRPIHAIRHVRCPLLVIGGTNDLHTTREDTQALFEAAPQPKELWFVPGAAHENYYDYSPAEYERIVLGFIKQAL
jgi:uncharacterized protein